VPQPKLLLLHLGSETVPQQQLRSPLQVHLAALELAQALALLALALLSLKMRQQPSAWGT
jgi:hypothetical protein